VRLYPAETDAPVLLALRALKLGDLLVAVPAIHGLRRAFPNHFLTLAVPGWLGPIVDLIPGVDALLPTPGLDALLPVSPGTVDIAVNLHGNGAESRRIIQNLGARLVIAHRSAGFDGPPWQDGVLERRRWVRLVNAFGADANEDDVGISVPAVPAVHSGCIVIHVGAFYGSRQWPVERFAAVARAFSGEGETIVFTGSAADQDRAARTARLAGVGHVLAGAVGLDEFAAIVAAARLVVTADTGAGHLATAYGTPSVVIFGPAPPEEWGPPPGGRHIVLTDARLRRGETFSETPDPALLAVSSADVISAARELLGRLGRD
jgi:ADP-heptose:LPS heptosyltransferase